MQIPTLDEWNPSNSRQDECSSNPTDAETETEAEAEADGPAAASRSASTSASGTVAREAVGCERHTVVHEPIDVDRVAEDFELVAQQIEALYRAQQDAQQPSIIIVYCSRVPLQIEMINTAG